MECKSKGKKPWLLMAVCKCFWPKLMLQGVLLFSEVQVTRKMDSITIFFLLVKGGYHTIIFIHVNCFKKGSFIKDL